MKYRHKLPDASVNTPKTNVLFETLKLLTVLVFVGFIFYLTLNQSLRYVADKITPAQEKKLVEMMDFASDMGEEKKSVYLQEITDSLTKCAALPYEIETFLLETQERNAFALPSGKIYVTRGMLQAIENENELINIIGHELGHFKHKDHLKGLGNSLVLAFLSLFMEEKYGMLFTGSLKLSQAKYSQQAEYDADVFGLSLMQCAYKSVRGATTLFARMDDGKKWVYFLETHPDFGSRVANMQKTIAQKGYTKIGEIRALKETF